jgi:hypothetical protein
MLNTVLYLVFLAAFALFAYKNVDRTKTMVWLVVQGVFTLGMLALSHFYQNVYIGLGCVSVVVAVVRMLAGGTTPLMSNLLTYAKTALAHLFFFPVVDFETVYVALKAKV